MSTFTNLKINIEKKITQTFITINLTKILHLTAVKQNLSNLCSCIEKVIIHVKGKTVACLIRTLGIDILDYLINTNFLTVSRFF